MAKHAQLDHADLEGKPVFTMKVVRSHYSALSRQIHEAVRIRRNEENILNSKGQYNRCQLPRLTVKMGDKDVGEEVLYSKDEESTRSSYDKEEEGMEAIGVGKRKKRSSHQEEKQVKRRKIQKTEGRKGKSIEEEENDSKEMKKEVAMLESDHESFQEFFNLFKSEIEPTGQQQISPPEASKATAKLFPIFKCRNKLPNSTESDPKASIGNCKAKVGGRAPDGRKYVKPKRKLDQNQPRISSIFNVYQGPSDSAQDLVHRSQGKTGSDYHSTDQILTKTGEKAIRNS